MLKRVKSDISDRGKLFFELLIQTATPFGVLLLSLILTGLAWYQTTKVVERDAKMTFERQVSEAKNSFDFRIQAYINILRASQGLFAASQSVERDSWKTFVESLNLQKLYPGINGIGFIRYVPKSQKASYEKRVRQDTSVERNGYPDFVIKPPGDRPAYFAIEYIEPLPLNRRALGLDVGSEPVRRAAVERARDTGEAAATGQIVLVQDSTKQSGFLILLPVYRQGIPHNTVEEKRRALLGFVYAPLRVKDLIEEALPNARQRGLELEVYNDRNLMYRSDRVLQLKRLNSNFSQHLETTLDVAGQSWELTFFTPKTSKIFLAPTPILVLSSGTLISFLLFGITQSLTSSRQRAQQLATQMTADLRTSENLLRDFFDSANDLIQSVSLDRKFIFVNQAWKKTLGYSEEEIGQLSLLDILHPDSRASYLEMLQGVLAGSREAVETTFITKEGRAIALEGKINCRFENGVPQVIRGIFRDISKRKQVEALLQQSYDQLELRIQQRTAQLEAEIVERKRAGEEIRLLQTITKAITESPNFEQAIAVTLKKVCQTIGWNFAEAWIPDPQDLTLVPSSAWYGSIERLRDFREASLENTFARHTGLPGRVWATKQPEWTKDVSTQPIDIFLRAEVAKKVGLKSALGVPILANEKVIAIFVFFTIEAREEDQKW
ncbi:MAG: PAS domain S-box protein [Hydrococcus sp. RM1_1_31]|nr:PAS domain S-box protein [Hydrococcus sp. RM1_1_31]